VTFARPELPLRARFAFQARKAVATLVISLWRAFADCRDGRKLGPPDSDLREAPLPTFRRHNRTFRTRPDFRLFPLFFALFFSLLSIAPAPVAFLKPAQSLAL